ncbi:hypothetical protein BDV95DRAFT_628590 [Massariosphaeria phaeospora]|uniref:Alpha/Beta hydrolase protein n=1 Tax=Massariosphaeria phaeospora TaxID=100035 RepID=A0A7C8IBL8_9PLEO|nr:hypothetical protein BDV95DRAFT_628590 [Massariosphaeria phaeospora]
MGALEFLCDTRFHKKYTLPPNPDTKRLTSYRVTYADYGDPNSNAVVLICGALMATRFCYSPLDQLAKDYNVRIIHPDRPGIGGTDPVPLNERIAMWLELVPQLLKHLGIPHIAIASHSGGIIYALNTILAHPYLLHPQKPYICFFAPWVHHSHSKVSQLRATELLPAPLVGRFASMARFVNDNVMPLTGLSSNLLHARKISRHDPRSAPAPVPLAPYENSSRASSIGSRGGPIGLDLDDPRVVTELRQLITTYLFAEAMDGISADARLFLKKPRSVQWCSPSIYWSDIDYVVPLFSKMILEDESVHESNKEWLIDAFHAETDHMVGEKGRKWFDNCWMPAPSPSTSPRSSTSRTSATVTDKLECCYDYQSEVVEGTEHNYIMDPAFGASEIWLSTVRAAFPTPAEVCHALPP